MYSITNVLKSGSHRIRSALGRAQVRTVAQGHHVQTFDEEDPSRYSPGSYRPVRIDDGFHNRNTRLLESSAMAYIRPFGLFEIHSAKPTIY